MYFSFSVMLFLSRLVYLESWHYVVPDLFWNSLKSSAVLLILFTLFTYIHMFLFCLDISLCMFTWFKRPSKVRVLARATLAEVGCYTRVWGRLYLMMRIVWRWPFIPVGTRCTKTWSEFSFGPVWRKMWPSMSLNAWCANRRKRSKRNQVGCFTHWEFRNESGIASRWILLTVYRDRGKVIREFGLW